VGIVKPTQEIAESVVNILDKAASMDLLEEALEVLHWCVVPAMEK